ncbi:MAG: MFS transporter [Nitrosomonadaceae bacterium]|nr:MFS transporter [Nitrosomonadaceae bacterium]
MSCAATIEPTATLRDDATIISLVGFAHGTSHFFHLMLPPLFPFFMAEWGLGYAAVGVLMSIFFVTSSIGQAVAGIWVDRYGAHRVLFAGIATLSVSGLLVAVAPSFGFLMFAAFVAGAGNSIFHPADFALINRRVSAQRLGHAFSVHGLSGNLGWAAGPVLMLAAASAAGWRAAGFAAAVVGVMALSLLVWKRHLLSYELAQVTRVVSGTSAATTSSGSVSYGEILRHPMVWAAFAFFFLATFGFGALQNFAPSLLQKSFDLSLGAATSALSTYLVGGACGLVLGGFLAKPSNQHEGYVAIAFGCGAIIALSFAVFAYPAWVVLPLMALMGFAVGIAGPSRDLLVRTATKARLGEGAFGRVYGLVYSGLDVGLALAPIAFGMMLDRQLVTPVFVGIALSFTLAIAAAWTIARIARAEPK